jgi:hypothetical protein
MLCATGAVVVIGALALSACGDGPSSPTEPIEQTTAAASTPPLIVGIGGTPFGTGQQTVAFHGKNFQAGLSVIVTPPGGDPVVYSGTQVRVESDSLATVSAMLTTPGQYTAQVRNPGGMSSNVFAFQVYTGSLPPGSPLPLPSPPPPVPSPSPVPSPGEPGTTPSIAAISPASPATSAADQPLVVTGNGFRTGLTVTVTLPIGGSLAVSGDRIQNVSSTRFELSVTLRDAGVYTLRVTNPDGGQSDAFAFAALVPVVSILSVSPADPVPSEIDQRIVVTGAHFQPGLIVTIGLPGGGTSTLSGNRIQNVSPSRFEMLVTLGQEGTYRVSVINPDGRQSNVVTFTAVSGVANIFAISPPTPRASQTEQRITVFGTNFRTAMIVTLGLPGGGTFTRSGGQIQNFSSSRFEMLVTLRDPGSYSLRITNPDGRLSNVFFFTVL